MRYLGGKFRIAKHIVPVIQAELAQGAEAYYEPFMGGGHIFCRVDHPRKYGSDIHPELMALWQHVQAGGELPTHISEAEYAAAKRGEGEAWWRGFVGFGCSFGGKWFGGYARTSTGGRNYANNMRNGLMRYAPTLQDATLSFGHYQVSTMWVEHAVIYCDPPYANTTGYASGTFDHAHFWAWAEAAAADNVVLVSEYAAPPQWPCVLEIPTRTNMRSASGVPHPRTERLFRLGSLKPSPPHPHFVLDSAPAEA